MGIARRLTQGKLQLNTILNRIFNDVIMIEGLNEEPFSRSGDSGALVYNVQGSAIGIIFAMSNSISIVCPLQSILRELNCTLFVS
jgi:hypothetical protein